MIKSQIFYEKQQKHDLKKYIYTYLTRDQHGRNFRDTEKI